mmetsp:Transcript_15151/g.44291  ORF Transcript_15151/g.44291 Transcript_15151/m.44291 type:complete len:205 (-) Transcript_15151:59-673(-)
MGPHDHPRGVPRRGRCDIRAALVRGCAGRRLQPASCGEGARCQPARRCPRRRRGRHVRLIAREARAATGRPGLQRGGCAHHREAVRPSRQPAHVPAPARGPCAARPRRHGGPPRAAGFASASPPEPGRSGWIEGHSPGASARHLQGQRHGPGRRRLRCRRRAPGRGLERAHAPIRHHHRGRLCCCCALSFHRRNTSCSKLASFF